MTTLYTGGTFDCFHAGHVNLLRQCRQLVGDDGKVVVALNTDEFVEEYKGRAPVISFLDRWAVVKACRYVDVVVSNMGGADSTQAIKLIGPNINAIDTGWACKDYYAQMGFTQKWLDGKGIVLVYLPRKEGISTTEIRKRL
jgi:cytidyltransferase-like protein